jgi:hypothetical protein
MNCIFQRNYNTAVRETENGKLLAETRYCDTKGETAARLELDKITFIIDKACLEVHERISHGEIKPVSELCGIEAYLGSGQELKGAFAKMEHPLAADLFAETVRGIIQAETFLHKERGYASMAVYSKHWDKVYADSCRYYSNLDRIDNSWGDYAGEGSRQGYLFLRAKTYFLYSTGPGEYLVAGSINDTFHEMNACLKMSGERILAAEGNMLRVPHDVCKEATEFFRNLAGADIKATSKKAVATMLGKGQGCVHLIDMVDDAVNTLRYYQSHPGVGTNSARGEENGID